MWSVDNCQLRQGSLGRVQCLMRTPEGSMFKLIFQRQPSCSEKNMLKKLSKINMEAIRGDFLIFTSYSVEHLEKIA